MPSYTVVCAEKASGQVHALQIAALSEEDASHRINSAGFMVSRVFLAAEIAPPPPSEIPPQLVVDTADRVRGILRSGIVSSPITNIALGIVVGNLFSAMLGVAIFALLLVLGVFAIAAH